MSEVKTKGTRSLKYVHIYKQECIPVGCVSPACCSYLPACTAPGVYMPRGVYLPGGCTCPGGVPGQGVYLPGGYLARGCTCPGVYLPRGDVPAWGCTCREGGLPAGGVPAQVLPPPVNRMTDRCKNITLPQTSVADGN